MANDEKDCIGLVGYDVGVVIKWGDLNGNRT